MTKFLAIFALAAAGCVGSASISIGDGGIEEGDAEMTGEADSGEKNTLFTLAPAGTSGRDTPVGDGDGDDTAGDGDGDGDGDGSAYIGGYEACDTESDCPLEGDRCVGALAQSPFDPDNDGSSTYSCRTVDCWSDRHGEDLSVCPTPPPGGNATIACLNSWCAISCAGGLICPDGMVCFKDIVGEQCFFPESIAVRG